MPRVAAIASRTVLDMSRSTWLLRPEIHSDRVGAGLGSRFTHLIREASLAGGAGGIIIRDHCSALSRSQFHRG